MSYTLKKLLESTQQRYAFLKTSTGAWQFFKIELQFFGDNRRISCGINRTLSSVSVVNSFEFKRWPWGEHASEVPWDYLKFCVYNSVKVQSLPTKLYNVPFGATEIPTVIKCLNLTLLANLMNIQIKIIIIKNHAIIQKKIFYISFKISVSQKQSDRIPEKFKIRSENYFQRLEKSFYHTSFQ